MNTTRSQDRMRAAGLRAVSGDASAELRGAQLRTKAGYSPVNSPYLTLAGDRGEATARGLADAMAMVLRHNDADLHRRLRPHDPIERVVFDILEQLRCQSLAPDLPGVRANLAAVTDAWCRNARADGVAESGVGLQIYTLTHMARARLGLGLTGEEVDSIIEGPRARLGRLVGHALKRISETRHDQRAFAEPAREMARLLAEMAADTTHEGEAGEDDAARYRMLVPADWLDADGQGSDDGVPDTFLADIDELQALDELGGYQVFTRDHDVTRRGEELYLDSILRRARHEFDDRIRAQAISAQRLGLRLRRLFSTFTPTGWEFAQPEGYVDGRRLAQLVGQVDPQHLFRRPQNVRSNTTAVTLLLDNSGSMKAHRYETLAVLADTLSRALDLAGVTNEILGHTTDSWSGGQSLADWKAAGRPEGPGRVADLARIIYKDAETPWRRARASLAAMTVTRHFRESIDGEAIVWAHQRLLARPEPRRLLVVVSDGAPAESGTAQANGQSFYLAEHFAQVVRRIERSSPVEIAALSIGGSVDTVFSNSTAVDLDTTLTLADYAALERLFV
ncbi:MAG: cobalt chelatase [Actinomycetota bacterium]